MRELTDHKARADVEDIRITVADEAGEGGACHRYELSGFSTAGNGSVKQGEAAERLVILFQNGGRAMAGANGVTQEALLAIVADRLRAFQAGPYPCDENHHALLHVEAALDYLRARTRGRMARGVEGVAKA